MSIDVGPHVEAFPAWTIDGEQVADRLRSAGLAVDRAQPVYLRDKPGETAVVGYRISNGARHELGCLRWSADLERARNDRHKGLAMGPAPCAFGPGLVGIGDHATMRVLPNDARLRRARWYLTPRKLKRTLADIDHGLSSISGSATSVEVLAYKPERRIVARLDLGASDGHRVSVVLRYTPYARAPALAATAEHLRRHGVSTPRPIAQLDHGDVGIDEFLDGVDLSTAARQMPHRVIGSVAEQIARLHRTSAPPGVRPRPRAIRLAEARRSLIWLSARGFTDRHLAMTVARTLVEASAQTPLTPGVLVHGDLHGRNVLVDLDARATSTAHLIDLDRMVIGEAALDLGRLLATSIAGSIAGSIADSSMAATPHVAAAIADVILTDDGRVGADRRPLALHTAIELVSSALTAARQLDTISDPDLVDRLLHAALAAARDPEGLAELGRSGRGGHPVAAVAAGSTSSPPASRTVPSASDRASGLEPERRPLSGGSRCDPSGIAPGWMAEWPRAYPRPTGDWTAAGDRRWARLDPERGIVGRVDPADDRKLPALARAAARGELIGYRAGRRAVVAAEGVFVKVVRPDRVARLVAVHEALAATVGAPAVPRVAAATDDGAVDFTVVRGTALHDLLRRGADNAVLVGAASALAVLHATPPPEVLELGTPDSSARWVAIVGRAEPSAAAALAGHAAAIDDAVAAACAAADETHHGDACSPVIVHGDCHDKNVFLDRVRSGFIDLDGVRLGRREDDVANLAVHVALRELQSGSSIEVALARRDVVVTAYRRWADLDDDVLGALERSVWFRLACLYRFRARSRPLVPTLLLLSNARA